ncbi:MAG: hypothetical protein GX022_10350 [Clostridiaceae bacterium]|nr:hypothetical protein [Clostridiaceae bacterium]
MVSLVSGDVNKDGIDDLAATWGYYYGPYQNIGSTAVVMLGAKGTAMLTKSQQFDLTYGSSDIVRGTFVFGDIIGGDSDSLVLCGQSDADLKSGNKYTRYVAVYSWNGEEFTSNLYKNFDLFAKEDGKFVWEAMTRSEDKFYSLPLCVSNAAIIPQAIGNKGPDLLYFDSLLIGYDEDMGLYIEESLDITDTGNCVEYVEYGAAAGDIVGKDGSGILFTMTQTLYYIDEAKQKSFTIKGTTTIEVAKYREAYYYKTWFHWLFTIESLNQHITVRAYFTDKLTHQVTLPGESEAGTSKITYVTPILADDDGNRDTASAEVRDRDTVIMTFVPNADAMYATDVQHLQNVLLGKVGEDKYQHRGYTGEAAGEAAAVGNPLEGIDEEVAEWTQEEEPADDEELPEGTADGNWEEPEEEPEASGTVNKTAGVEPADEDTDETGNGNDETVFEETGEDITEEEETADRNQDETLSEDTVSTNEYNESGIEDDMPAVYESNLYCYI